MIIATLDDYKAYSGQSNFPENITFLLARANELIYARIQYTFNPNKEAHVTAAKNAVCAQILFWVNANISPFDISVGGGYSLGDLSVSASESSHSSPTSICPMALVYLRSECLTYKGIK